VNSAPPSSSIGPSAHALAAGDAPAGLPALPKAGDVVAGKYRIEKIAGEGGMGIVYAAHHLVLDQRVALKLLLVDSLRGEETVERFVREAQAAARLRSEHVVRVTDAGATDRGLPFLVMEYLQGHDLAGLVERDGPLPSADVADYLLQVLSALAQAHTAGIVHRDLKPANLFLALREDGSNIIKVLDFGVSKQKSERTRWKELTGKAVLGTPAYMSPEQLRSSKNVDASADIWSLGVVMYELLSGKLPFDGESPGEMFAAILEKAPLPLRVHCPGLAQAWEEVVMRCLRRVPQERFADVGELARALARLGSGRWGHLVPAIGETLARPTSGGTKTDTALLAAAVSAAATSLPPPMRSPVARGVGDRDRGVKHADAHGTLGTGKTLVADLLVAQETTRRKPTLLWGVKSIASIGVASLLVIAGRASMHRMDHRSLSSAASGGPVDAIGAVEHTVATAAPVGGALPMDAAQAQPLETPPASTDESPPDASPAPPKRPVGALKPGSVQRPPQGTAARRSGSEARPTFLKSWR
jgi:eukaryotic-like serine/threonine-protein kinase